MSQASGSGSMRSEGGRFSRGRGRQGAGKFREGQEGGRGRFLRKKICKLCAERVPRLDCKETEKLLKFLTEKGKILPQRISGNCTKHQRMLARAVKRARHASLIPFEIGKL